MCIVYTLINIIDFDIDTLVGNTWGGIIEYWGVPKRSVSLIYCMYICAFRNILLH